MVFRGKFHGLPTKLDPHFTSSDTSPVARFRPDFEGWVLARSTAEILNGR